LMKIMRTPVIAQAAPLGEHDVDRCVSQRAHVGKRRDEALEVRNDRRDLRLLEHDLGEPDPIRVARCWSPTLAAAPLRCPLRGLRAAALSLKSDCADATLNSAWGTLGFVG